MGYTSSYWEKDSFLQFYDLLVIGAGIVGLSSALFYKQSHPDARVAVLERGFLPQGASTRNAGFACVGSIGEHLADLEKDTEENVRNRILWRYRGLELLKKTLGEKAIGYEHCGGYEFFRSQDAFADVANEIPRFNHWMGDIVGVDDVYSSSEMKGYPVIYNRLEGALHPGKMMRQLVKQVNQKGIPVFWNSKVEKVGAAGTVVIAEGPNLNAEKVLLATNGFSRRLLPELNIVPARGYVMVTDEKKDLAWKGVFHHDKGYIYFRNIRDKLLIGGARNMDFTAEETDEFGTNKAIKNHLVSFVTEVLRLPKGWSISSEWSGIMGFTPTKTPVIQQVKDRCYVAAGLSGMGIAIGMEVGSRAAEMLQ